jgi:hypothetical protein
MQRPAIIRPFVLFLLTERPAGYHQDHFTRDNETNRYHASGPEQSCDDVPATAPESVRSSTGKSALNRSLVLDIASRPCDAILQHERAGKAHRRPR